MKTRTADTSNLTSTVNSGYSIAEQTFKIIFSRLTSSLKVNILIDLFG